jgi:hypothetical protein
MKRTLKFTKDFSILPSLDMNRSSLTSVGAPNYRTHHAKENESDQSPDLLSFETILVPSAEREDNVPSDCRAA